MSFPVNFPKLTKHSEVQQINDHSFSINFTSKQKPQHKSNYTKWQEKDKNKLEIFVDIHNLHKYVPQNINTIVHGNYKSLFDMSTSLLEQQEIVTDIKPFIESKNSLPGKKSEGIEWGKECALYFYKFHYDETLELSLL